MKKILLAALAVSVLGSCSYLAPAGTTDPDGYGPTQTGQTGGTTGTTAVKTSFNRLPGQAQDIAIGGTGANEKVYIVGWNSQLVYNSNDNSYSTRQYDGEIYYFNATTQDWDKLSGNGRGRSITVDNTGSPWLVNSGGEIYRRDASNSYWQQVSGQANAIGSGSDGSIFIIGYGSGNKDIYNWNGSGWTKYAGNGYGTKVESESSGKPWLLNDGGEVYRYDGYWNKQPGRLKDIGCGANGTIFGIGYGNGNRNIYQFLNNDWTELPNGLAVSVDVDQTGNPWIVNKVGEIYN